MELTNTMLDRQKLAATVIIAQIKLPEKETPTGLRTWMSPQGKIQKYSNAHYTVPKDVLQFTDICGHTWRMQCP